MKTANNILLLVIVAVTLFTVWKGLDRLNDVSSSVAYEYLEEK